MSWQLGGQERHFDGATLEEKFEQAQELGFSGIELAGGGGGAFRSRLDELRRARRSGVVMPSVCVAMDHFIGDFDADRRRSARLGMQELLSVIGEVGGRGAITPAAFGLFSRCLPPFEPPRGRAEDRAILVEELGALGEHARSAGTELWLEPLNRYEDHMVNTLADAVSLVEELGLDSVRVMADTFHMSIEEAHPAESIVAAGPWIGHVQLGDSNRMEPGAGHEDWAAFRSALTAIGYQGWIVLECGLTGPPREVLPRVARLLAAPGVTEPA